MSLIRIKYNNEIYNILSKYIMIETFKFLDIDSLFNMNKLNNESFLQTKEFLNKEFRNLITIIKYNKNRFFINHNNINRLLKDYNHSTREIHIFLRLLKIFSCKREK